MVGPASAASPIRTAHRAARPSGSRPVVGSSRNSTAGRCTSTVAMSSRLRMPPEYVLACRLAAAASPNWSSSSATRRRRSLPRIPYRLPCMARFSCPVSWSTAPVCWLTEPITDRTLAGCLSTSMPATRAVPASGSDSVVRILTVVVLPAPLGPSSSLMLPATTENVSPSRARTSGLYVLRRPLASTRPAESSLIALCLLTVFCIERCFVHEHCLLQNTVHVKYAVSHDEGD